jgi:hypothetical protein
MIDLKALAAPFPADRVSWRVGSTTQDKKRGMALAYIDARDVQDRLDAVCGPENWQCRYSHTQGKTVCEIGINVRGTSQQRLTQQDDGSILVDTLWVWKADGAGDTDFEAEKGALSDAFKRAAVRWGIGRYLYDVDAPWVEIEPAGKSFKIAQGEYAKLRAVLTKGAPAAPPPPPAPKQTNGKGFHLVDPKTAKVTVCPLASKFLEELEHNMAQGDPVQWWGANGSTARHIATLYPQAVKRVEALEQMAIANVA